MSVVLQTFSTMLITSAEITLEFLKKIQFSQQEQSVRNQRTARRNFGSGDYAKFLKLKMVLRNIQPPNTAGLRDKKYGMSGM